MGVLPAHPRPAVWARHARELRLRACGVRCAFARAGMRVFLLWRKLHMGINCLRHSVRAGKEKHTTRDYLAPQ